MDSNSNINNLRLLQEEYAKGTISVLVGAGFSMNVSALFKNWDGLLKDLIEDLYRFEIKQYIDQQVVINSESSDKLKEDYITNILKQEGYLGVVKKYIDQRGYHEVIDDYIEEHTPYAVSSGENEFSLYIQERKVDAIPLDSFSAHSGLLNCNKFRYIFTTNYDNLLEFTSDNILNEGYKYVCVIKTSDLSKDGGRKIIKLHGSLNTFSNSQYGFDGDKHLSYIISQEDYDSYIEKHETFYNLVRLTILQGTLLLVGFSGKDPNYLKWMKWLREILVGSINDDFKQKIFSITFNNDEDPSKNMYNTNHYITEINLMDKDVLSYIGFSQTDVDKLLSNTSHSNKKDVLTMFFEYLSNSRSPENEVINNSNKIIYKTSLTSVKLYPEFDYKELWKEASAKFYRQEDLSDISERIKNLKTKYLFCQVVYNQERFIDTALRRKGDLTKPEAFLFALAIKEAGQLPHYYSPFLQDKPILDSIPLWQEMVKREDTLKGNTDVLQLDNTSEYITYENIQRKLFHLDFEAARNLLENWDAKGYWLQAKAMRLAIFHGNEEAFGLLSTYIEHIDNAQEKMYACVLANFISLRFPRPYNLDNFFQNNIYGQGEIISYILEKLKEKEDKPKQRGWIGSSYSFGFNNTTYEQSLRFLQFIFDTGLYLNYGITYFVDIKEWYKICKNLFIFFPYPCFFYSIQYNDKDVLERIGQDYAFTPDLLKENQDLLLSSLKAYGNNYTPEMFLSGILSITGPLYLCVDESIWFDTFKTNIFDFMITHISEFTYRDPVVKNIENAVSCLKNKSHLEVILENLLQHAKDNIEIAQNIICSEMNLKYFGGELNEICSTLLEELIGVYPQIDITEVVYFLNVNKCLPKRLLDSFMSKLKEVGFDEIPSKVGSLFYICVLAKDDKTITKKAKQKILEKDIWHCGVLPDGYGLTTPNYIRLQFFKDVTNWNTKEFKIISNNLKENLNKYNALSEKMRDDSFMKNTQITYLSDVLQFIDSLSASRKKSLEDIRELTKSLLNSRISYDSFIEAMLSEQSADVSNGIDNIVQGIRSSGLESYHNEINFIVDRAIIGEQLALSKTLSVIAWLIECYEEDFNKMQIDSKLLILLSVYKNRWQKMDEFRPDYSFEDLHYIADYLKKKGYDNESIQYWLTDSFVRIFL